ncbi:hypothetical protein Acr_28g0009870 [Actinidia rufa]|uniref:Uncharacterized protein n=1 Tax=Actinidia rufa TaxID=165716 RepID=A0A7J0HB04_9ERIC|nr:hypothetical protein Acr_28g0009870 [Actinidia rufa]
MAFKLHPSTDMGRTWVPRPWSRGDEMTVVALVFSTSSSSSTQVNQWQLVLPTSNVLKIGTRVEPEKAPGHGSPGQPSGSTVIEPLSNLPTSKPRTQITPLSLSISDSVVCILLTPLSLAIHGALTVSRLSLSLSRCSLIGLIRQPSPSATTTGTESTITITESANAANPPPSPTTPPLSHSSSPESTTVGTETTTSGTESTTESPLSHSSSSSSSALVTRAGSSKPVPGRRFRG